METKFSSTVLPVLSAESKTSSHIVTAAESEEHGALSGLIGLWSKSLFFLKCHFVVIMAE